MGHPSGGERGGGGSGDGVVEEGLSDAEATASEVVEGGADQGGSEGLAPHPASTSGGQRAAARPARDWVRSAPASLPRRRAIQRPERSISRASASSRVSATRDARRRSGARRYRSQSASARCSGGQGTTSVVVENITSHYGNWASRSGNFQRRSGVGAYHTMRQEVYAMRKSADLNGSNAREEPETVSGSSPMELCRRGEPVEEIGDARLVEQARCGDDGAFGTLVLRYRAQADPRAEPPGARRGTGARPARRRHSGKCTQGSIGLTHRGGLAPGFSGWG